MLLGRKAMTNLDSVLKSRDITLLTKAQIVKTMVLQMWELNHKESWALKNWTVMLETTLESPWDCKEIQPVNPKGNKPWIFIGRTAVEASIHWPLDSKSWLTGKDPAAGKDWGQKEATEDERVGWHHWLNGGEFEQILEESEGQGSLVCCSS